MINAVKGGSRKTLERANPAANCPEPDGRLNQKELARRWGLSPRTLERWRWRSKGPPFLKLGARVVYRMEDVAAFEAANLQRSTLAAGHGGAAPNFPDDT